LSIRYQSRIGFSVSFDCPILPLEKFIQEIENGSKCVDMTSHGLGSKKNYPGIKIKSHPASPIQNHYPGQTEKSSHEQI
jgi:hypothetical protein